MKLLKACPMVIGTLLITIALSVVSFVGEKGVYSEYSEGYDAGTMPHFILVFKGLADGVYPWSHEDYSSESLADEKSGTSGKFTDNNSFDVADAGDADAAPQSLPGVLRGNSDEFVKKNPDYTISGNWSVPISGNSQVEQTISGNSVSGNDADRTYEYTEVTDEYFDDALFIGDSRTVGLSEYCPPLDERSTFYAKVSLTIYAVMNKQFISRGDSKISVEQALSEKEYGKIYIMLGINEMGTGTTEYFAETYSGVIDRIRELQPNALIFIQGIMHVTEKKSNTDKYFNNANIDARNEALSQLADNKTVFYMDMNEAVDDGKGNLDSSLTFDDVHLKASSYQLWYEFLLQHGIVKD